MIIGAHTIIYSTNPDADRAFFRDVVKFTHVDVGDGWLVFGLPSAELAIHPAADNELREFYLMCDDMKNLIAHLRQHRIPFDPVQTQAWGLLTRITLPGGGKLGVYEPRHPRPRPMGQHQRRRPRKRTKTKAPTKKPRGR